MANKKNLSCRRHSNRRRLLCTQKRRRDASATNDHSNMAKYVFVRIPSLYRVISQRRCYHFIDKLLRGLKNNERMLISIKSCR